MTVNKSGARAAAATPRARQQSFAGLRGRRLQFYEALVGVAVRVVLRDRSNCNVLQGASCRPLFIPLR